MTFSNKLKAFRKEKGLTQKELSDLTGISVHTINSYESGRRKPNYNSLGILEEFFNEYGISIYDSTKHHLVETSAYDISIPLKKICDDNSLDSNRVFNLCNNIYSILSSNDISPENKDSIIDLLNNQIEKIKTLF